MLDSGGATHCFVEHGWNIPRFFFRLKSVQARIDSDG